MKDYSELKKFAENAKRNWQDSALNKYGEVELFIEYANPTAVIELITKVEALKDQLECADEQVVFLEKQVKQLVLESASLKKYAARYRWTTIEGNWVARMFGKWRAHIGEYGYSNPTDWFDTREEAIDAAMSNKE